MTQTTQVKKWHVAQWGLLGWLETIIKFVGIVFAWIAFANSLSALGFSIRNNPRLAALIVLTVLTLPLFTIPILRYVQREIVSFIYSILNLLGHVALLIAVMRTPGQQLYPIVFGACYIIGELVKQRYLAITGYTEVGASPTQMVTVSRVAMALYILLVIFMIV